MSETETTNMVEISENDLAILTAEAESTLMAISDEYWHPVEGQRVRQAVKNANEVLD